MNRMLGKWVKRTLLTFPVLFCCFGLSAQVDDLKVSLPGGTMTYGEIFALVESQNDVLFGYTQADFDVNQRVELPRGTASLDYLLDRLFDGTPYQYLMSGEHILITRRASSEPVSEALQPRIPVREHASYTIRRPRVALKSNLLYDLTTSLNLGVEVALGRRWTLDIPFQYNLWEYGDDTRFRHWGLQPEFRYWFCERFSGWFIGLHAHYAKFNVGGLPDWGIFSENMQLNRYQGYLYGGGLSVGYGWILKNRWSMEVTAGFGYARIVTNKYPCANCGISVPKGGKDYIGPTKVGLSLVYVIK